MIECYKYLRGTYCVSGDILPRDIDSSTRGHSYKLKKPTATSSVRQNFFSTRVVNAWNSLPDAVVSAPTLNTFKNRLDRVWAAYKFSEDSEWFKTLKPMRTTVVFDPDHQEDEATSNDDSDRHKGE